MRKSFIKTVVLLAVFAITVAATGLFSYKNSTDMTSEMAPATLPVVYLQQGETRINGLYGYSSERVCAIPLPPWKRICPFRL